MSHSLPPLQGLCDTAMRAARAAGQFIAGVDRAAVQPKFKDAGDTAASQIVTEVDLRSEVIIREHLEDSCARWNIAFVGEESSAGAAAESAERLSRPFFWCVDPLDGTLAFTEGLPGYAVSIALVAQSGVPLIGVVYEPATSALWHAVKGQGAYRDGVAIRPAAEASTRLRVLADTSFRSQERHDDVVGALTACAHEFGLLGAEWVYGSGAVKNACQVLEHAPACYVKLPKPQAGGGSLWDFAATACILREAGGWASNASGEPLDLNRADSTFMNHEGVIFASSESLGRELVKSLARL